MIFYSCKKCKLYFIREGSQFVPKDPGGSQVTVVEFTCPYCQEEK